MALKLTCPQLEPEDGFVHVHVAGAITTYDFQGDPINPLERLLGVNWNARRLLLDFDEVPTIDSAGIGWLIASNKQCKNGGGQVAVHSIQPAVLQMLKILRIDKLLPLAADAAAARAALAGPSPA